METTKKTAAKSAVKTVSKGVTKKKMAMVTCCKGTPSNAR